MHTGGWKPFWAALGAALLVLLPLVGGTILLTRQMLQDQLRAQVQTAESQRGIPIDLPKESDRMTLLLCTAGETPGFVLCYLNAPQNALHLLAVPGELTVPFGNGEASLSRCYAGQLFGRTDRRRAGGGGADQQRTDPSCTGSFRIPRPAGRRRDDPS